MKRVLSLMLALVLIVGLMPLRADAAAGGKLIALTFDDGPDKQDTPRLLDGLAERGVKVTFFMQGKNADYYPDIVSRVYQEGHEIGSHSWDHPNLVELTEAQIRSQFSRSYEVLDETCGQGTGYLVRPPYGNTNEWVREIIDTPLIYWSVDPEDWDVRNAQVVRQRIVDNAYDGAIVLVHDIHSTTIDGALMAIDDLLAQGYEFVTVSELFRRRGVELENCMKYYDCKNNGTDLGPIPAPEITYTTDKVTMTITIQGQSDAPIYYTTDGSCPNGEAALYTGPFTVDYPTDIKAVAAYRLNGSRSDLAVLEFGKTPCAPPEISVENGVMTLTCQTGNVDMYYTLDGSAASLGAILYTGPVEIPGGHYIRAVSGGGYYKKSAETVLYYSETGNLYADVKPDAWYFEGIDRVVTAGVMNGVGEHKFAPMQKLTRGMLVTLLYRYSGDSLGENWTRTYTFRDVKAGSWYEEGVEWAYRSGIVNGYSSSAFGPDDNLTRQELCKVVDYFLAYRGNGLPAGGSCADVFADYERIAKWALPSVEAMVSAGLIQGDGRNMNPLGNASRAEVAVILTRVMDYEESLVPEPEPETEPTAPTGETEPPAEQTDPTESSTEASEPIENPTTPSTEATVSTEESTEPSTEPSAEPSTESTDPPEESTASSGETES